MLEDQQLSQMFLRKGLISDENLKSATSMAEKSGRSLYDILLKEGLVDEERAIVAVSKHLNLPCVSLKEYSANPRILELIPRALAEQHHLIPLGLTEEGGQRKLFVAMANPLDIDAIEEVSNASGFSVSPLLAGPNDITIAVERGYHPAGDELEGLGEMLDGLFDDGVDDLVVEEEGSEKTPAKPTASAANFLEKPKPSSLGFSLDFGDLGLSVARDKPKKVEDVHQRRTLPAGTELPQASHDFTRTRTAVRDVETVREVAQEEELASLGDSSGSELNLADEWSDLGDFDLEDDAPPPSTSQGPSRAQRTENSTIRYVADASLKSPARSGFPFNVPSADLARAAVRLLIKKGLFTEREIREELKKLRG